MKFRKKPVVIDAVQFDGGNHEVIAVFCMPQMVARSNDAPSTLIIPTLEGHMTASAGDWVIKGVKGECYPCKPDVFESTYERVD